MIEYITTMKYVKKYLQPGMRILEIGAATGRYSHALAQKGYCVDAVELVEHNIEIFKQNTTPGETVTITQGNAMDLSMFEDDTYTSFSTAMVSIAIILPSVNFSSTQQLSIL